MSSHSSKRSRSWSSDQVKEEPYTLQSNKRQKIHHKPQKQKNERNGHSNVPSLQNLTPIKIEQQNKENSLPNQSPLQSIRVLLDARRVGALIGKKGAVITQIRQSSNCNILISKPVPNSHHRLCTITGEYKQIATAIHFIIDQMHRGDHYDITLLVEALNVGNIIGKAGKTITDIRKTTNATIFISRGFCYKSSEKAVDISGKKDDVHSAMRIILNRLLNDETRAKTRLLYSPLIHASDIIHDDFASITFDSVTLRIAKNLIGVIIGRGGRNIEEIRRQTKAVIKIDNEKDTLVRLIQIQGTLLQVSTAVTMIQASLQVNFQKRYLFQ